MWVKWAGKFTANLNRRIHITEKSLKQYQKINSAFLSNQAIIPMKSDCQRLQHRKVKFKVNMPRSRENLRQSQRLVHKDRFLMQHWGAVVYRYANKFSAMLTTFPSMFQSTQSLHCKLLLVLISGSISMLLPQQTVEMIEKVPSLGNMCWLEQYCHSCSKHKWNSVIVWARLHVFWLTTVTHLRSTA